MKRILSVLLLAFGMAWAAGAQEINAQIGFFYQNGKYSTGETSVKNNFLGASVLLQFEPFFQRILLWQRPIVLRGASRSRMGGPPWPPIRKRTRLASVK